MLPARDFISRFRRADRAGPVLDFLSGEIDGFQAAMGEAPEELRSAMEVAASAGMGPPVQLAPECFAAALCDSEGRIMAAEPRFREWFGPGFALPERELSRTAEGTQTLLGEHLDGRLVALVCAPAEHAARWPISAGLQAQLGQSRSLRAILAFCPSGSNWRRTADAFNLTPGEAGLAVALARTGDLRRAAVERGIAYETARKFLASTLHKTGSRRQTDLVRQILLRAAGDLPDPPALERMARDLFDLTERQARLAVLIARGQTRDEAAQALGIADHRAKADLRVVFTATGVASATELARLISELGVLQGLATACDISITPTTQAAEPLRLVPRNWAEGRIAVTDHGPPGGFPVLVFHTLISGRHQPRRMIAAMRAAGLRPILMERAGFGLSDPLPGDPIQGAARDAGVVADALELKSLVILGRGNSAACLATAAGLGARAAGGVLLGPGSPWRGQARRGGLIGVSQALFLDHPGLADAFVRLLSRRTNRTVMERMLHLAVRHHPSDRAALADPDVLADFIRGGLQSAAGMSGFLNEALALARGPWPVPAMSGGRWAVLYGAQDVINTEIAQGEAYWRGVLPDVDIEVLEDGGRFLHVTHTAQMAAALRRVAGLGDRS